MDTQSRETPPRAWGRVYTLGGNQGLTRNTPTGVGKTPPARKPRLEGWKHPHGRGEDVDQIPNVPFTGETPPRAWGRVEFAILHGVVVGNTPTCVGKRFAEVNILCTTTKHPHVRGEESTLKFQTI